MRQFKPVTPGELLLEEFLKPMEISQYRLAKEIGVPAQRIGDIVAGKRTITADTDLRLCWFLDFPMAIGYGPKRPTTRRSQNVRSGRSCRRSNPGPGRRH
jgi:addiction module HigA family antidote